MLTFSGAFFDITVYSVMCELYKRVIKKIDDMQICTDISDWKPIVAVYSHLTQKQVSMFISNGIIHKKHHNMTFKYITKDSCHLFSV